MEDGETNTVRDDGELKGKKTVKLYLSIDEDEVIEHAAATVHSSNAGHSGGVWKLKFALTPFKYQLLFCQADKILWSQNENNYDIIFTVCQKLYSQYNQCLPFTFTLDKNGNKTNSGHYPEISDEIAEMSDIDVDPDLEDDLYLIIYNNKKQQIKYSVPL